MEMFQSYVRLPEGSIPFRSLWRVSRVMFVAGACHMKQKQPYLLKDTWPVDFVFVQSSAHAACDSTCIGSLDVRFFVRILLRAFPTLQNR